MMYMFLATLAMGISMSCFSSPPSPPPSSKISQRDILNSIDREMSGDLREGFKTVGKHSFPLKPNDLREQHLPIPSPRPPPPHPLPSHPSSFPSTPLPSLPIPSTPLSSHSLPSLVMCARNRPGYFADKLYQSMKGAGTDDDTLIRIVVSRSEVSI